MAYIPSGVSQDDESNNPADPAIINPADPAIINPADPASESAQSVSEELRRDERKITPVVSTSNALEEYNKEAEAYLRLQNDRKLNPATSRRVFYIAGKTGYPTDYIYNNIDQLEADVRRDDFDAKAYWETSPITAKWASENPYRFAAIGEQQDLDEAKGWEWLVKSWSRGWGAGRSQVQTSEIAAFDKNENWGLTKNAISDESEERIELLKLTNRNYQHGYDSYGAESQLEKMWVETARLLPMSAYGLESSVWGGAAGVTTAAAAGLALGAVSAPLLLAGGAFGALLFGITAMTRLETGGMYLDTRDLVDVNGEKIDDDIAWGASQAYGSIAGFLEVAGGAGLLKSVPGFNYLLSGVGKSTIKKLLVKDTVQSSIRRAAKNWVKGMGGEVTTELTQSITQMALVEVAKKIDPSEFETLSLDEAANSLAETFEVIVNGTAFIAAGGPTMGLARDIYNVKRADNQSRLVKELTDAKENHPLSKDLPNEFRNLNEAIEKEGGVENITIEKARWDEFYQDKDVDPREAALEITGSAEAYDEAEKSGNMVITLPDYADKIIGTEQHEGLSPDVRMGVDSLTLRERNDWVKNNGDYLKELDKIIKEGEPEGESIYSQEVYDAIVRDIKNDYEPSVVEAYATQVATVLTTLGERTNTDPVALLSILGAKPPLKIKTDRPTAIQNMVGVDMDVDPILDALRSGKLPPERDVFGPSLLEFIDENGGISQDESTPKGPIQSRNLHKEKITGVGGEKGGSRRMRLLVRKGGQSLVDLTQAAYEAGFIPENNTEMFLDAISAEVGGERQVGTFEVKEESVQFANKAAALEAELDRLGVDVKDPSLTNDAIKLILAGVGVQPGSVEEAMFQGGANLYYLFNEFLGSSKAELSGSTKTVLWQRLATAISLLNTDLDGLRDYKEINIVIDAISDVAGMDFIEFIKGEIKGVVLKEVSKEETDRPETTDEIVLKAREDFDSKPVWSHDADTRREAIAENFGEDAAQQYEAEFRRLSAAGIAAKTDRIKADLVVPHQEELDAAKAELGEDIGECLRVSTRFAMRIGGERVEGIVKPLGGARMLHAWVEKDGIVYDVTTGVAMSVADWNSTMGAEVLARESAEDSTVRQMREKMFSFKSFEENNPALEGWELHNEVLVPPEDYRLLPDNPIDSVEAAVEEVVEEGAAIEEEGAAVGDRPAADQALFEEAWDKANSIEELSEITLSLSGSDIISTLAESMEIGDVGKVLEQVINLTERRKARNAKEHQALIQERGEIETEMGAIDDLIKTFTKGKLDPFDLENQIQALMFDRNKAGETIISRFGELIYDPKEGRFGQIGEQKTTAKKIAAQIIQQQDRRLELLERHTEISAKIEKLANENAQANDLVLEQTPREDSPESKTLYHVTLTENTDAIKNKGILPMQTSNWAKAGTGERYGEGEIFTFESWHDAVSWATNWSWDLDKTLSSPRISIVAIKQEQPTLDEWEQDTADPMGQAGKKGDWLKRRAHVPSEDIINVVQLSQDLLDEYTAAGNAGEILQPPKNMTAISRDVILEQEGGVSELGFFSKMEKEVLAMNLPGWKKDGAASGKEIWQKVNKLPLKKEEKSYSGIEEFLMTGEKFTRQDVLEFIRGNGVILEEVLADELPEESLGDLEWDTGQNWDDSEAWEYKTEEYIYDFDRSDLENANMDWYFFRPIDWMENNIRQNPEAFIDNYATTLPKDKLEALKELSTATKPGISAPRLRVLPDPNDVIEFLQSEGFDPYEDMRESMREEFAELADEAAKEEYFDDPIVIYTALDIDDGLYIFGNEGTGYDLRHSDWSRYENRVFDDPVYSLNEAFIQAREWAVEEGAITTAPAEGEIDTVARWGKEEFQMEGEFDNYREYKLRLPDDTRDEFTYTLHFADSNIVAFLRVNDRVLLTEPVDLSGIPEITEDTVDFSTLETLVKNAKSREARDRTEKARQKKVDAVVAEVSAETFFIDELQSDWHQQGRKFGYEDPMEDIKVGEERVPDAPFKNEEWQELAMKRALFLAVAEGKTAIAWPNTGTLVDRYNDRYEKLYQNQYDRRMVTIAKRLTGNKPVEMAVDGSETLEVFSGSKGYHIVKITPEKAAEIRSEGFSLFQGDTLESDSAEGPRGTYNATQNIIRLLESKDLSTFLHESGHFYMEVLGALGAREEAPQQIKDDIGKLKEWFAQSSRGNWADAKRRAKKLVKLAAANPSNEEMQIQAAEATAAIKYAEENGGAEYIAGLDPFTPQADSRNDFLLIPAKEQFARGFEAYLFEGKAPSVALRNAFASFKSWLTQIYKDITELDVKLNDEVRGVFDRMVATDEAINNAQIQQQYEELIIDDEAAEAAGIAPEFLAHYRKKIIAAKNDADENLLNKLLKDIARRRKPEWGEKREALRSEAEKTVYAMPVYKAIAILRKGKNPDGTPNELGSIKLSKEIIISIWGEDFIKRLRDKYKSPYVYTAKDTGVHPDDIAELLGYTSGEKMLKSILNAKPMQEVIEQELDRLMERDNFDSSFNVSVAEEAQEAAHSQTRSEVYDSELDMLRKMIRADRPAVRAAEKVEARERKEARAKYKIGVKILRIAAEKQIGLTPLFKLNLNSYRSAEAQAGKRAFAAMEKKDYEAAYEAKQQQAYNHEMFRIASKKLKQSEKTRKYLSKFVKRSVRERLGKAGGGLLEQIESILSHISLKRVSAANTEKGKIEREAKVELLTKIENGEIIASDEALKSLANQTAVNWREMTVDEFEGVNDVIRQLEKQAADMAEVIIQGEKIIIQEAADELSASLIKNATAGELEAAQYTPGSPKKWQVWKKHGKQLTLDWLRPGAMARLLDGGDEYGAFTRLIIIPIRRAVTEKLTPREVEARESMLALYEKHFTNEQRVGLTRRISIEGLPGGSEISRSVLLSLALNWGNSGNRAAVLLSEQTGNKLYAQEDIERILGVNGQESLLKPHEWDFVIAVWEYIDTYREELFAAEKRRSGVSPKKIEAEPFTVTMADGTERIIPGGYYPLYYESQGGKAVDPSIEEEWQKFLSGNYLSPSTKAGAAHDRRGTKRDPVQLNLDVIDRHLREVIRDIAIGDEVRFAYRLLNNAKFKNTLIDTGNREAQKVLTEWLQDVAVGELAATHVLHKILQNARLGFTASKLAWNAVTVILQLTGIAHTFVTLGPKAVKNGILSWSINPVKAHKRIFENSAFMKTRYELGSYNKDIADAQAVLSAYSGSEVKNPRLRKARAYAAETYFYPIALLQRQVDEWTWLAAESVAVERGLIGQDVINFADAAVENAQTSGIFSDRSGIERGSIGGTRQNQFVKTWTVLISYMLAKGNIFYEKSSKFKRGFKDRSVNENIFEAIKLSTDFLILFTLEAVLSAAIRGRLPDFGDDDDDEKLLTWLVKETGHSMAGTAPFVRDVSGAIQFDSGRSVTGAVAARIGDVLEQTEQGEIDLALFKALNDVGGVAFKYPSTFINRQADSYYRDVVLEEDVSWLEYFTGKRIKDED